jgi:hypothetical protein
LPIEIIDIDVVDRSIRKVAQQSGDSRLHEMNARRFERFEKPARKAHCNTVAVPGFLAFARDKSQRPRFGKRFAVQILKQRCGSFVIAHEAAAVDVSVSRSML